MIGVKLPRCRITQVSYGEERDRGHSLGLTLGSSRQVVAIEFEVIGNGRENIGNVISHLNDALFSGEVVAITIEREKKQ